MNTCKKCKYWHRKEVSEDLYMDYTKDEISNFIAFKLKDKFGDCKSSKMVYGHLGEIDTTEKLGESANELLFWDGEMWKAFIQTGENFGCIHYKKR